MIETDSINYYTLKIINNNPDEKPNIFYNLVFEQNFVTGTVESSILQYNPELSWLLDKTKDFEGSIKKFDNAEITLDDLINGTHLENRSVSCVFSISSYWYCPNGHSSPDDLGGNCGGEWVIDLNTGPCPPNTGGGGTSGGGNGDGGTGGGGSSGSTQTVILEICDGFSLPGEGGNSEDCIEDYAMAFMDFLCPTTSNTAASINYWGNNNTQKAEVLYSYLHSDNVNGCVEIDFEELVVFNEPFANNPKMKCVYEKVKEAGGLKQLSENFFDEQNDDWGVLDFSIIENLNCNDNNNAGGCTRVTHSGGDIHSVKIEIDLDYISNTQFGGTTYPTPMLYLARTLIHESIHANLYFALIDLKYGNIDSPDTAAFNVLYEEYREVKEWQHPFMANHYLDIIAQELENVHPLLGDQTFINNNSHYNWDAFYENLAWVGLQGTDAFLDYNSNPQNASDFQLYNVDALVNSTVNHNCQ